MFAQHYGPVGGPYDGRYDLSTDGRITGGDLNIFSQYYHLSCP
jgi:hypothetical protein